MQWLKNKCAIIWVFVSLSLSNRPKKLYFFSWVSSWRETFSPRRLGNVFLSFQCFYYCNWLNPRLISHCEAQHYEKKKTKRIKTANQKETRNKKPPGHNDLKPRHDLKPFRSYVKGKHSGGNYFQCLALPLKKLLAYIG